MLGRILLLALVLLAALLVARTCGSQDRDISQDEAIEIAREAAGFTPCDAQGCVVVRVVPRGIPPRQFWLVGLAEAIENGEQVRFKSFLIDAKTGEVTRA